MTDPFSENVVIGDLSQALDRIAAMGGGEALPLVTDARLLSLHGAKLAPVTLEAIAGIGALLHGEAVAIGMVIAFRLAVLLDQCPEDDVAQLADHLASVGLPTRLDQVGLAGCGEAMLHHLGNDKKATSAGPALILVRGIGRAYLDPAVPRAALERFTHSL